jgi:hypothetical protein
MAFQLNEQQQIALAIVPRLCVAASLAACGFVAKSCVDELCWRSKLQAKTNSDSAKQDEASDVVVTKDAIVTCSVSNSNSTAVATESTTSPHPPPAEKHPAPICTSIYHRIMLSISLTYCCLYIIKMWGPAAVPETYGIWGATGNVTACTIHGFFIQLLGIPPLFYYMGLSFYSFAAVTHNFQLSCRFELYLHVLAWTFPIGSAFYLLKIHALNFNGYSCWIASAPLGCGDKKDYPCTRGPQNIGQVQILFGVLPVLVVLVVPTIVMFCLVISVKRNKSKITTGLDAMKVAIQSGWYLAVLYESALIYGIDSALLFGLGKQIYWYRLLAISNEKLFGLFVSLVYFKMRVTTSQREEHYPADEESQTRQHQTKQSRGNKIRRRPKRICRSWCAPRVRTGHKCSETSRTGDNELVPEEEEIHFTIFDGNAVEASPWANYLFEGESDDEDADNEESMKWESIVQY